MTYALYFQTESTHKHVETYWKVSNRPFRAFEPKSWRNKRVALISAALFLQYVDKNGEFSGWDSSEEFKEIMQEITHNTQNGAQWLRILLRNSYVLKFFSQ
ncbi:unnamed protein product [Caenorhabditis brenneri]